MDPAAGSPWSRAETVAGFVTSPPNAELLRFASQEQQRHSAGLIIDIGCGAARNAVPLAAEGWSVLGIDYSLPMLGAAAERARQAKVADRFGVALARMDRLPVRDRVADLIVAHGIWNLATSGEEFRRAVGEAARIAKVGAGLFVFTFSRNTLPDEARPVPGESFVFTQFSGSPQCFLTKDQLVTELGRRGFASDPALPIRELNRPAPGAIRGSGPVIYEGAFRYQGV